MSIKPTKRKAFNFLRSYFDVYNNLKKDEDKLSFLDAILNKQFLNVDPVGLDFIPNLCYESQRHAIESSVKGWLRANKTDLQGNPTTPPPTPQGSNPPTNPKEEKEKEEEKEEHTMLVFSFRKSLCGLGLDKMLVDDFLKNRKLKKLANTETAFKNLQIELNKSKIPLDKLFNTIVSNGWGSFKNSWLEKDSKFSNNKKPSNGKTIGML